MRKAICSASLIFLTWVTVVWAASPVVSGNTAGNALTGAVSTSARVLLFAPYGNTQIFAYTDDATHILAADGSRSIAVDTPSAHAYLRGDTVTIASYLDTSVAIRRFSADTLEASTSLPDIVPLDIPGDDLYAFETDRFGRLYAVLFSEPNEILVFDAAGSYTGSLLYAEPVLGLQVLDDTLCVFFETRGERLALDAAFPQVGQHPFSYAADRAYRMLSDDLYVDGQGNVCRTDGAVLLRTEIQLPHMLTALSGDRFFWAPDTRLISVASLTDTSVVQYAVDGTLEALTADAMLLRRDNAFYCASYSDFTPSTVPTATASPTPEPSAEPEGAVFRGSMLLVPEGTTAAQLRNLLAPADVQVYTKTMATASGKLKTGYTAAIDGALYTVIVPGDLNASGTVNTADLRLFQRFLVGDTVLDDDACQAADLNGDGSADAADLVLFAERIAA